MTISQPPRILPLKSGHNFRDMGGYPTREGRQVKWRTVYRSGYMSRIDDSDREELHRLGIDTICDFRSNSERDERPTIWHEGSPTELWSRDHEHSVGILFELMKRADPKAEDTRNAMVDAYRTLPYEQSDSYREFFGRLAAGRLPILFNCSAGKDRTGVAAAILLDLLGVSREQIVEDYMISNNYIDGLIEWMRTSSNYAAFVSEDIDRAMPLMSCDASYLDTTFATIESNHGSTAAYLAEELGIAPDQQARIREYLLD